MKNAPKIERKNGELLVRIGRTTLHGSDAQQVLRTWNNPAMKMTRMVRSANSPMTINGVEFLLTNAWFSEKFGCLRVEVAYAGAGDRRPAWVTAEDFKLDASALGLTEERIEFICERARSERKFRRQDEVGTVSDDGHAITDDAPLRLPVADLKWDGVSGLR